jgi:hypothetical protein
MKKILKSTLILGITFFSLSLISCKDKDIEILDYRLTATAELISQAGDLLEVSIPQKIRITFSEITTKANQLELSYTSGESRSHIYIVDSNEKILSNEILKIDFVNNYITLFYVPENGGTHIIQFTIKNGDYSTTVDYKFDFINSGATATYVPPQSFVTYNPTEPIYTKIILDNPNDEDNFFNITLGGGNDISVYYKKTGASSTTLLQKNQKIRIFDGIGSTTLELFIYKTQEGSDIIDLSIDDKYRNLEEFTWYPKYYPTIEIEINGYGIHSGYFAGSSYWYNFWTIPPPAPKNYNYALLTLKATNKFTGDTYTILSQINISFQLKYKTVQYENVSDDDLVFQELVMNNPFYFQGYGNLLYAFVNITSTIRVRNKDFFIEPLSLHNFKINNVSYNADGYYDSVGRKYIIKNNRIKFYTATYSDVMNTPSQINDNNADNVWIFNIP